MSTPPDEKGNHIKTIGALIAIILFTLVTGKGCSFDVACVGCLNVESLEDDTAFSESINTNRQGRPKEVTTPDGRVINCAVFRIPKAPPIPELDKIDNEILHDPSKMVRVLSLHVSDQNEYIINYKRQITRAIERYNLHCN